MTQRRITRVGITTLLAVTLAASSLAGQGGGGQGGGGRGAGAGRAGGPAPPIRDTNAQTVTGSSSISGMVVLEGTGTPVRRARVSLAAPELRGGRAALTDDQGRFSFAALPAGRFTITASKSGFVDISFGAKRAGRPGTPVQLAEGQTLERLTLAMPRGGVLTGIVVDEHGEPSAGTQVRALRYVMQTGERRLQMAGQDQTDDRGMYRIFQLQPGEFIVNAVPRNVGTNDIRQTLAAEVANLTQQLQAGGGDLASFANAAAGRGGEIGARIAQLQQQMAASEQEQSTAYAPVYYPGTASPAEAQSVPLAAGEERGGVDFQLRLVSTTRVTGIVTGPTGAPPAGTTVALVPASAAGVPAIPGLGNNTARVGAEGRFTFNSVTPGDYVLQARATVRDAAAPAPAAPAAGGRGGRGGAQGPISQVLWASVDIGVGGQPLPDIVLTLQDGMTVSGQVQFDGTAEPPADLSNIRVTLAARGPQTFETGGTPPAQVNAAGRFTLTGVAPGRYALTAVMAGSGGGAGTGRGGGRGLAGAAVPGTSTAWTLRSAMYNGQDLLDFPIEIGPNQSLQNVVVTYGNRVQELTGTIQDTSGRPTSDFTIIVFPSDAKYWMPQARRITATRPGTDGRFTFRGLPAGDYRLTAVTDVEPGEWYDPAFLTQLAGVSIPIALGAGERKVQDIRLAGG